MAALVAWSITATAGPASHASAPSTVRASVSWSGGDPDNHSFYLSVSDGGQYVAFHSQATNLVPGDNNVDCGDDPRFPKRNCSDIFLRDVKRNVTTVLTRAIDGGLGNGRGEGVSISGDGSKVAFVSWASDLVPEDNNDGRDVFVYDVPNQTLVRASVSSSGVEQVEGPKGSCNASCGDVSISHDGRYVVFDSWAPNLVPGDTNEQADVFLRDLEQAVTERISDASDGSQGNDASWKPRQGAISDDARFVVFQSAASNLVPDDTNRCTAQEPFPETTSCLDVFVRDRKMGRTTRVSVASDGAPANDESGLPFISGNGRYVAFSSDASNLVAGDTNGVSDVFVKDQVTGTVERVSVSTTGEQANGDTWVASITGDGRLVSFTSRAGNLVPNDANGALDVFVHDRATNTTVLASVATDRHQGDRLSTSGMLSRDGTHLAFKSDAGNLVPGDSNGKTDVFLTNVFRSWIPDPPSQPTVPTTSHRTPEGHPIVLACLALAASQVFWTRRW